MTEHNGSGSALHVHKTSVEMGARVMIMVGMYQGPGWSHGDRSGCNDSIFDMRPECNGETWPRL